MKTFYSEPKITLMLFEATDAIRTSGLVAVTDGNNDFSDPFGNVVFGGS